MLTTELDRLPVLADKMLHLGISVQCVRWVMAALSKRRCIMKYRDWRSEWTTIHTGLPQGSPLSPVLFNIYTLDLARLDSSSARVRTFADDVLVSISGKSKEELLNRMSPALDRIKLQCDLDGDEINGDKAAALFCTLNNRVRQEDIPIPEYGGTLIEPDQSLRYLGVVFDKQLNFTAHINSTLQRASRGVSALKAAAGRRAEERHLLTLYKALVLSVIDYALPMLQLSLNQLNRLERIQNTGLRTVTGCTRSTPIPVLHYLAGVSSIDHRQQLARAVVIAKASQEPNHGVHDLTVSYKKDCLQQPSHTRSLRPRPTLEEPVRRLKRKSWVDHSFKALNTLTAGHLVSEQPMWRKSDEGHAHRVVIRFGRECREWTQGAANDACNALLRELGSQHGLVIATDGSFALDSGRAGWGFAVYSRGQKVAAKCGAHNVVTSSTRVEVEAVRQALTWLVTHEPEAESVIVATDSQALLSRVKSGWLPDGWVPPSEAPE